MPTYAYACKSCGHRFDAVQSFADASLTDCPECGGPLRKEYGQIGVTFNGSGFYRTDSRAGDKAGAKSSDSSGGKSDSSGGKSDSSGGKSDSSGGKSDSGSSGGSSSGGSSSGGSSSSSSSTSGAKSSRASTGS